MITHPRNIKHLTIDFDNKEYQEAIECCSKGGYKIISIKCITDARSGRLTGRSILNAQKEIK